MAVVGEWSNSTAIAGDTGLIGDWSGSVEIDGGAIELTDTAGVTDAVTADRIITRAVSDTVGISDSLAVEREIARLLSDTAGITDLDTRVYTALRSLTDTIALTAYGYVAEDSFATVDDAIGLGDAISALVKTPAPTGIDLVRRRRLAPSNRKEYTVGEDGVWSANFEDIDTDFEQSVPCSICGFVYPASQVMKFRGLSYGIPCGDYHDIRSILVQETAQRQVARSEKRG